MLPVFYFIKNIFIHTKQIEMKLKDLLKKDNSKKLNEAGLASYYNRAEAPVKSAAKKVDQMLNDLIKDKGQMAKLIDAITDLADEYAQERIDNLDSEMSEQLNESNNDMVERQLSLLEKYAKVVKKNPTGNIIHFAEYVIDGINKIRKNL